MIENLTGHVAVVCHVFLDAADHLHRLHLVSRSLPNHEALDNLYVWAGHSADEFTEQALSLYPSLPILEQLPPIVAHDADCCTYVEELLTTLSYLAEAIEEDDPILYATLTSLVGTGLRHQYRLQLSV